jgi:Bacterial Ig-like domain (group 2)
LQSITVLPTNPIVPQIGQTTQFLALGTLVGGGQEDLTSTATWSSSNPQIATVNSSGTATTLNCGTSAISAQFQPNGGTPFVGTTLLTVSCNPITSIELLITKLGSTAGTVTSVPTGINCGTVCGGLFNEGTGFVLTAAPAATWTGCDQVIGGQCYFTLVPDTAGGTQKVVTATF